MKGIFLAGVAVLLLHAGAAAAEDGDLVRYTLPNGLRVVLAEDHASPEVVVTVGYDVGAKDEPEGRSGFAHLFEHLMFSGTERLPDGQLDTLIEGGGGWTNAYTNSDQTVYYDSAPSNMLPLLLWIEADRMANFGRAIDQSKLDLQRAVVLNERRQNTEDAPYGEAVEEFNALMFPSGHPYHTGVIGSPTDIEAATVDDVRAFFATYYGPNNAVLVITGDFDGEALRATLAEDFGTIPALPDVPRRTAPADPREGIQQLDVVDRVTLPLVILGWPAPAQYAPGQAAASVLASLLQERLESRLVYQEGIAASVGAYVDARALGSVLSVNVAGRTPEDLPAIEAAVDETLAALAATPPGADEIAALATSLEYGVLQQLEAPVSRAIMLAELELRMGRADGYEAVLEAYRALTPADIAAAAKDAVDARTRSIVQVLPESAAAAAAAAEPEAVPPPPMPGHDPGPQPTVGEPSPFTVPEPEIFTLSNGIEVRSWHRDSGGITHLAVRFGGGSADDGDAACGAASLLTDVLLEGPEGMTREAFRRALRAAGATMGAYAHPRATIVTLDVLTRNAEDAIEIVDRTLRAPHLDEATVATLRTNAIDYANTVDDPDTVMWRVLRARYYGDGHPYRCRPGGTAQSLPGIDIPTLGALRDRLFVSGNTTVFAVTDLSQDALEAMLEGSFGAWPAAAAVPPATVYPPMADRPARLLVADLPGSAQTRIALLAPGAGATAPDRAVLEGVIDVLGGSFTSRLNGNLREDKGYTYGISAYDDFDPKAPSTWIVTDVQADSTAAALGEILAEVKRIETGDITAEEAEKAANGQTADLVTSLADPGGLIGLAIGQDDAGRPFDELTARLAAIGDLSAGSLNAAAPGSFELDRALILLIGDKDVIMEQLAAAKLPLPAPEVVEY